MKFAQQIEPHLDMGSMQEIAEYITQEYDSTYVAAMTEGARNKLGLETADDGDFALYEMMLTTMTETAADFTASWRALEKLETGPDGKVTDDSKKAFLDHIVKLVYY